MTGIVILLVVISTTAHAQNYKIVDTNQTIFFDNNSAITAPVEGEAFYGQDAQYSGHQPSYTDNGDGTVTDNVTGLMWQQYMGEKIIFEDAFIKADSLTLANFSDWRVPTLKELYSLILFTGMVSGQEAISFFIDTTYFNQSLGDVTIGEREIDAQTWSSTEYVGKTMRNDATVFGVNFVDGRIKGYPKFKPQTSTANKMYFRMVRGNVEYGKNNFVDNGDNTVSDLATGLMWQKADDGVARDWQESLIYSEISELADHSDWRLPNAKELQSIVDYTRSPQTTNSPAIDPVFETTEITDPDGNWGQYPFFWTGTTHLDGPNPYSGAAYIAFGEGLGLMNGTLMDVHGAGCQRSDPKSGNINDYPQFFGPQGDVRYVYNYVRLVRDADVATGIDENENSLPQNLKLGQNYPNPFNPSTTIQFSLSVASQVSLKIYNIAGQLMTTLVESELSQGNHAYTWHAAEMGNGIFFYTLKSGSFSETKSMILMK